MHGRRSLCETARFHHRDEGAQQIDVEFGVHDLSIQLMELLNLIRLSMPRKARNTRDTPLCDPLPEPLRMSLTQRQQGAITLASGGLLMGTLGIFVEEARLGALTLVF